MKTSELIKRLSEIQSEFGDLPVYCACDDGSVEWEMTEGNIEVGEPWGWKPEHRQREEYPKRVAIGSI